MLRKFLTKKYLIAGTILLVGLVWWWNGKQAKENAAADTTVAEVSRGRVVETLMVSGEIKASDQATLNYPAPGRIAYVGVEMGDIVRKWQLLAYLDMGDLQAIERKTYYAYLAADAYAKLIEDQVKGHESDESFAMKNSRVAAQTARDSAYDTWLSAQRAVKNSKLISPFNGVVTNVTASAVGDTASITDGITVVDPLSLYFSAEVDETDVGRLNADGDIEVELDAFPGEKFSAKIETIGFVAQQSATGATVFPVKLVFSSELLSRLKVGMNGDARIILAAKDNVLKVQSEAIVDGKATLENDEQKQVDVRIGLEGDTEVEIVEGLKEGDRVIITE